MIGLFAFSRAGHDKNKLYIIIREESEYVYVADGKNKPVENAKRKYKKHIQIIKKNADESIREKLIANHEVTNEEIKKAVKVKLNQLNQNEKV